MDGGGERLQEKTKVREAGRQKEIIMRSKGKRKAIGEVWKEVKKNTEGENEKE